MTRKDMKTNLYSLPINISWKQTEVLFLNHDIHAKAISRPMIRISSIYLEQTLNISIQTVSSIIVIFRRFLNAMHAKVYQCVIYCKIF